MITGVGKTPIDIASCAAGAEQVVAVMVSVTSTVPDVPVPQVTVMELPVFEPTIVPPTTVHAYVFPVTAGTL